MYLRRCLVGRVAQMHSLEAKRKACLSCHKWGLPSCQIDKRVEKQEKVVTVAFKS
jgi:hypothetical protein